jgi:hypothetical protein
MAKMSEEPLSDQPLGDETLASIHNCANDAMSILGPKYASAVPATVVEAVDEFAYRWQKGKRPPADVVEDTDTARLIFGSLWGEQLVKQFSWEWAKVNFGDGSVAFGVVSPDRSLAIYPLDFMLWCMETPRADVTVALSFNMLLEGRIPPDATRESYTNLMKRVIRIVPRD